MQRDASRLREMEGTELCSTYTLERLLGSGGMGAVFAARDREGRPSAVKILHRECADMFEIRERFLREARAANAVNHPGAVRVIDEGTSEDERPFIVMDLLEGESLHEQWKRLGKQLPPSTVVELSLQLLDVLSAAHDAGIVHRDIKPENLFVTTTGELKVLDFGIARMDDGGSVTLTGTALGTPAFMASELALGLHRYVDARTDLWATAAVMFTLLTGEFVHVAANPAQLYIFAGTKPARAIRSVMPNLSEGLAAVIDRALAFERADRWPDARSMRSALVELSAVKVEVDPTLVSSGGEPPADSTLLSSGVESSTAVPNSISNDTTNRVDWAPALETRVSPLQVYSAPPPPPPPVLLQRAQPPQGHWRRNPSTIAFALLFGVVLVAAAASWARAPSTSSKVAPIDPPPTAMPTPTPTPAPSPISNPAEASSVAIPAPSMIAAPATARGVASSRPRHPSRGKAGPAHSSAPDCNPPYFVTAAGIKEYKPDCI